MDRVIEFVVHFLSIPVYIFLFFVHLCEEVRIKYGIFSDRLFMKRFNLIDDQHVWDLIAWNEKYRKDRNETTRDD